MFDLYLAKSTGGILVPVDQPSSDYIAGFPLDTGFRASVRTYNNIKFHRKLMALFQFAFDLWEPGELHYQGEVVRKNFDQFRKDITILAGYYDASVDYSGRVRLTAKSLNFARMKQPEREQVYSSVIDVILTRILTRYTRADLDAVVAQTLEFSR